MKRLLFLILLLSFSVFAYATVDTLEGEELTTSATIEGVATTDTVEGQVVAAGGPTYLVNLDMETTVSWSETSGTFTEDCDYDSNGDYCYDTSVYKNGAKAFGIEEYGYFGSMTFAAQTDFYADFWIYTTDVTSAYTISFYDTSDVVQLLFYSNIEWYINNGDTNGDTGVPITASVWWHIRLHYVYEVAGGNDGELHLWASTSDADFDGDAADFTITTLDTGTSPTTKIRLHGPSTGSSKINRYDDVKVWAGP